MRKISILIILISVSIFIFGQPVANFTVDKPSANYCVGDTVFFTNTSTGTYVVSYWDFGDTYDTWADAPFHIYETAGSYNVSLTVTDNSGNSDSYNLNLTVNSAPSITLVNDQFLQSLTASSTETDLTYQWLFGSDTTDAVDSTIFYLESGLYSVIATNANGCSDFKSVNISIGLGTVTNPEDSLKIIVKNNILTPDVQDGANDVLFIQDLSSYISTCFVVIYNKWGNVVYSNENYTNLGGFTGLDNSGKELGAGTYYYVIKSEGRKTATGYVDIIR